MSNFFTINEFYKTAIECGIDNDPRGREVVEKELLENIAFYKTLKEDSKNYFDEDILFNPYSDSRILNIALDIPIKNIFCGIDMQTPELLLADRLNEKNKNIDLIISHHPNGYAYSSLYEVISMQSDKNYNNGVPINISEGLTNKRKSQVEKSLSKVNYNRDVRTAELLNLNYMCLHTVADNCVETFLTNEIKKINPYRVSDILDFINNLEEYKIARKYKNPPKLYSGSEKNKVGNFIVDMTGGAIFDIGMISSLANKGIGTLVTMYLSDNYIDECKKYFINVICAGHMASDSLGINLLFKYMREKTNKTMNIIPASGYIYVER